MATWQAIVGATTYALSGGNPFYRVQATGIGVSNVRNIKQRGPFQDGATRRDFRLDERFLNLVIYFKASTLATADGYRDDLAEIFKPRTNTPIQIRVTRDDAEVRQIDCYLVNTMDMPDTFDQDRIGVSQRVLIQLEAPNPIWYDPTLQNLAFETVAGGAEGFQIPMLIPWEQTPGDYINATQTISYAGNYKEYPLIVVTGPADDVIITNDTTGDVLDFTGYSIAGGDTRTIDLRYGTRTVKDSAGALKNSELTAASTLGTWHLEPGDNDITVEILSGATTATQVSIQYYERYTHL